METFFVTKVSAINFLIFLSAAFISDEWQRQTESSELLAYNMT
jgi:hypothetical protein